MREPPRAAARTTSPRGGLPVFPLVLVVILAGLLLGGVLAHFSAARRVRRERAARNRRAAFARLRRRRRFSRTPAAANRRRRVRRGRRPLLHRRRLERPPVRPAPAKTVHVQTPLTVTATRCRVQRRTFDGQGGVLPMPNATPCGAPPQPPPPRRPDDRAQRDRAFVPRSARARRSYGRGLLSCARLPSETFMNSDSHIESIRSASIWAASNTA